MNDLSNTPVTTQIKENDVVTGFQTTHVEGAFEVTTQYDLDGQLLGEPTRVKKFTGVEITEMSDGFQSAWGEVVANLGSEFSGALLFEEDGDTITIKSGASLIGYATSWQGSGSWEDHRMVNDQPVLLEITDASKGYQIFDENWSEIASSGKSTRTITEVNGTALTVPVEDEVNVFTSYQIAELGYAGDWASLDPAVSEITWDNVASVRVNVNSTTNAENAYRPGESATTFTNTQYEYLDAGGAFMGSSEVRDGVTEVRDQNWNVVAHKADLNSALTFDEMAASLGQNWSAAWAEVAQFLPDAFKPGESGDYTTLKFAYDQWDNILVFAAGGDMVGRVSSWSSEHSNERAWNGDFAIWTHQSFTFNDTQGTNVARYEVNERYASANGTDRGTLEGEGLQVSYGAAKYSYNSNYEVIGASDVDWTEIEALYNLPAGQGDLLFATDWENDVDFVTVGTNTWKDYKFDGDGNPVTEDGELAFSTETSLRVEYFEMPDGRGWHREFLGAMEVRDGFIEIRDQNWNEVARIVDAKNAMEFKDIAVEYEGFAEAWGMVGSFLPPEMAHTGENEETGAVTALQYDLSFTADDYNIFVFDEAGNLISQVNYWRNDAGHEWMDWNNGNGSELIVRETSYHYNFHDANWESIAHAGVRQNYITAVDGQTLAEPILHEQGVNYGYRISKEDFVEAHGGGDAGTAKWDEFNPNVTKIDWADVSEVEINSHSNAAVVNDYREGEPWENSDQSINFFGNGQEEADHDNSWLQRMGSMDIRDGFIEVRDENWELLARKVDVGATKKYAEVAAKFGQNFEDALAAVGEYLPSAMKPAGGYQDLLFSYGEWDNILVFDPTGEMVGRINTWNNDDDLNKVQERPWNNDYQIHFNESFEFNDANWNQIARYGVNSNQASSDGVELDGVLESTGVNISYTVNKADVGADSTTWSDIAAKYALPTNLSVEKVAQFFGRENLDEYASDAATAWDAIVGEISIGTNTWKDYQYDDQGQPIMEKGAHKTDDETSERIEFFEVIVHGDHHTQREFLGVMEIRDGFIEIRDQNWNEVARIVDAKNAMEFKDIAVEYEGFAEAWGMVGSFLPPEMAHTGENEETGAVTALQYDLSFTADDYNIFVFDEAGNLISQVNYWKGDGDHTWTDWNGKDGAELTISESRYDYNFNDANWQSIAHAGVTKNYVTAVNGQPLAAKELHEQGVNYGYRVSKEDFINANGGGEAGEAKWNELNPNVTEITWIEVAEVQISSNIWTSEDHEYRDGEGWYNENTGIEFFVERGPLIDRIGSMDIRDGFIEVRDENWELLARKVDVGATKKYAEVATKFGQNFEDALAAVGEYLPSAMKPAGGYQDLLFSYGEWDNILVFDPTGEMVGRINTWNNDDDLHKVQERPWNNDYQIHSYESFEFNDANWNQIARYSANSNQASSDGVKLDGVIENTDVNISYTVNKSDVGADSTTWSDIAAKYALPTNLSVEKVAQFFGRENLDEYASDAATAWDAIVGEISIGTNTWKDYQYDDQGQPIMEKGAHKTDDETSERIEFFEVIVHGDHHTQREFLGVMEIRDGFIEIRDQNWNEVARIVDAKNAMEFKDIAVEYEGFAEAWGMVGSFLPPEMAHTGENEETGAVTALQYDLSFTADDYNIFVFDEAGNLISQVNYWKGDGDHTWTDWNGKDGAELTISESRYDYNFNDANWQSIAHAGVTKNYVTAVNGQPLAAKELHEQGVNYGYRVSKEDFINANGGGEAGEAKWNELNPNVTEITWIEVAEVEISSYENASVSHEYNDGEPWQNKNERIEFFVRYTDDDDPDSPGHLERVGSQETRDGFIEIRDENWDLIAQKADASALKSYETVLEKYGANFKKAWVAIGDSLSADFKPDAVDVNNQPVNADAKYKNLVFSFGEWNDILVFNPTNGQLIGKIDVWSGEHSHERPWSKDYQITEYEGYAFKDANWNEIAQYNVDSTYASPDGKARGNLENTSEQVSYAVYKADVSDAAIWDAYGVPSTLTDEQLGQLFETDWTTDVDYVSVGTQTWTNYQFDDDGNPIVDEDGDQVTEVELSERVEYYDIKGADENGHGGHRDYLGMKQLRDGFIEVRDGNWNEVAQVVDATGAVNFETIAANYSGFGAALAELDPYLPAFVDTVTSNGDISLEIDQGKADKDKLKFTFDDHGIYVFDNTNALSLIVNVWSQEETYFDGTAKYVETQLNYQFKDAQYNHVAEYGNRETKVTDTAAANPVAELDRSSSNVVYTITLEEAQAAGIHLPDFNNLPDPDSAPFALESVATVTVESNTWGSHANTFREVDNVWSGSAERLGFRDEYGHRLGSVEIDNSLVRVFDSRWNYVDSYVVGGADAGIGFDAFLNTDLTDAEMRGAFYELMGQVLPEFVHYKVIETSDGPDFLMQDGAIRGIVEEYDGGYYDDQEWFVYQVKDAEYRDLFRVGIGKNPDDNEAPIEPHSVFISTFEHRDLVIEQQSPEAWVDILNQSKYSIQDPDFKQADVAIIETRVELIDDTENDTHDDAYSETSYRFVSENSAGKQNWDYFEIIESAGVRSVEKSTVNGWETVEKSITSNEYFAPLVVVSETGSEDDQATAGAISYIFAQTAQIAPDIFAKYFGQGFDMDTQFYVNLASSTFILKDVDGDLLATGLTYERFNDGEAAMDFQIEWDFVNQDAPLVQNLYLRFDEYYEVDLTQEHSISIGERLIKNNFDDPANWNALIAEAVPPGVEGLDPARVHTIIDRDEVIIRPLDPSDLSPLVDPQEVIDTYGPSQMDIRKIVEFQQDGQEQGWEYTHNIKVQDGFTYVRVGNTVNASRAPDIGDLIEIADEAALGQIDSNLVEILNYSGLDLFTDFDVYKHDGLDTLYLTKAGSEDVVLYVTDETLSRIADGDEIQAGYNIYTVAGGESVGWLEKSVPGMPLPSVMKMGDDPVPGVVYYASQFNGIEATTLSEGILSQIQSQGTPLDGNGDSRYQFDDIDTFGIGQRMVVDVDNELGFGSDAVVLNAVTLQHEIEGVNVDDNDYDDPWVGRIFIEVGSVGVKVTQLYNGEQTTAGQLDEGQRSEFASLKSSLYASALTDWADYDPSASSNSETSLDSLADYSQSAQDILNETEYFKDIFGLMSVTDLGDGAARLQLGSGNQSAKIIIDDMSKQWSYQYQDTVSGFELSDASTGDFMGWLWQSNVQDWGILNAQGAATDTQILTFRINDVLDAMPSVYASNFAALGVSTSTPYDGKDDNGNDINLPYTVDDIDQIDIRRDVHFEVDANGDPVLDGGGHPVVVADQHMILHYDQDGLFLGGVGLDLISGKTFDFDENWDGWTTSLNYGAALTAEQLSASSKVYENIFTGIVDRLPEGLLTQDQLGDLCEIDPTTQYDGLVGDTYTDTVTGLDTFKSSGLQLDGYIDEVDTASDLNYLVAQSDFTNSLDAAWATKVIDFEASAAGNFAVSGYTALASDYHDSQLGSMATGATGTLVIDDAVSVTLFNTADAAGDGGNVGDDPGIATNKGNDADRGFNVTGSGDKYLEVLPGNSLSGGALFCFDELMAPVYAVSFTLMGVEETKRDVFIDVHLTDGTILRDVADKHLIDTGGYQFYGYTLDATYAQSASIEGFVVYEPHDGEGADKRDIFGIDDITVAYGDTFETLCTIDPGQDYDRFFSERYDTSDTSMPSYMSRFVSDRVELNGGVAATVSEDPDGVGVDLTSYHATVNAFADAVALMSDHLGFVVHDFEASALGNFAVSGYTAATGDRVVDQSGTMMDPMNGANGTLVTDGVLSVSLFNTGQDVSVDDPGIASHAGNDADRGFNMTISGDQYLEILPSEKGPGGALFCFDEINVPVYGFGFNFMGAEEPKRDIYIDVHMSDGSIYRETAEAHALETGGQQYYSYLADPLLSGGASIEGFVLYEDHAASDTGNDRDIFSVDDIALVVTDKVAQSLTPDQFANLAVNGPFSFEFVYSDQFEMALMDFAINPSPNLIMESTTDQLKLTSIGPSASDFVITIDAQNAFDVVSAGTLVTPEKFKDVLKLAVDPTHIVGNGVFKSTADVSDMVVSTSYHTAMTELIIRGYGDDGGILDEVQLVDLTAVEETAGSYLVSSTDGWEVELNTTSLTDTNGNGLLDEAEAEVLGLFTTFDIDTLVAPMSVA